MTDKQNYILAIMADPVNRVTSLSDVDRAAVQAALNRIAAIEAALEPFADMAAWLEALVELGEVDPMTDRQAVFQISGGGGSNVITVGDLRRAARALGGKDQSMSGRDDVLTHADVVDQVRSEEQARAGKRIAELEAVNAELLAACEFALQGIGRQTQFYRDDAVLARLALDIEAAVAKAKGATS